MYRMEKQEESVVDKAARNALAAASKLCRERAKACRACVEYHANPFLKAHAAEADACADDIDTLMEG